MKTRPVKRSLGAASQRVNELLIEISWKFSVLIMILMVWSGHKFAQVTTPQLSWHVQSCDLFRTLFIMQEQEFLEDLDYELINLLWNQPQDYHRVSLKNRALSHCVEMYAYIWKYSLITWVWFLKWHSQKRDNYLRYHPGVGEVHIAGIILDMGSANERERYIVTLSLIGWAHTKNYPCVSMQLGHITMRTSRIGMLSIYIYIYVQQRIYLPPENNIGNKMPWYL